MLSLLIFVFKILNSVLQRGKVHAMITEKNITSRILEIATDLTKPVEYAALLQKIIDDSMNITNSDGGTLYIMQDGALSFMIMITRSKNFKKGGDGKPVDLPPVELNSQSVCAYVAREKITKNIADVYNDGEFNWDGPKKYDALNNYRTKSELVVPLINHEQKVIGVLQLINAMNEQKEPVAYTDEEQRIVEAISSLAAVSLSNRNMINELQALLDSIALSFTDAIETRTPFNANHTRHVAQYCKGFAEFLKARHAEGKEGLCLTDNQIDQLYMAASLHDIGKLSVPVELLNKADRLDFRVEKMGARWKWMMTDLKVKLYSNLITEKEYNDTMSQFEYYMNYIEKINTAGFLTDEDLAEIVEIATVKYKSSEGDTVSFITEEEAVELSIRKGTLTHEERSEIEKHASYTSKILEKIRFGEKYKDVRFIAGAHHEYLNGTGYPNHLSEKDLGPEVRILTIMDIFDSLTAEDRPYKKPNDKAGALRILGFMVDEGKIDGEIMKLVNEYFQTAEVLKENG